MLQPTMAQPIFPVNQGRARNGGLASLPGTHARRFYGVARRHYSASNRCITAPASINPNSGGM